MALRPTMRELLEGLVAEGLVDAEVEARARTTLEVRQKTVGATPWFVKAMAGLGAWMAAGFLLSFFGCVGLWKEEVALVALGLGITVGAVALRRAMNGPGAFLEQLTLALCLSGAGSVLMGLGEMLEGGLAPIAAVGALLSLALLATFPDVILYFLATLGFCTATGFLAFDLFAGAGVDVWMLLGAASLCGLLLFEPTLRQGPLGARVGPIAFALACAVPGWLLFRSLLGSLDNTYLHLDDVLVPRPGLTVALAALALWTGWHVLREQGLTRQRGAWLPAAGAAVLLAVLTLNTPGVLMAVLMLTLGFHRRSRVMLGLAVAFLLTFGALYYYDLQLTLLGKSLALTGGGLVLLGARQVFLRRTASTALVSPEAP